MHLMDEEYTRHPFYGVRRMKAWLKGNGHNVNHKRIRRLMRRMGIHAIYPKPRLTKPSFEHKKYPYLLRGMKIDRADRVWCSDITYIRTRYGFAYLTVVMDWYSRYVLSFELSNTLDKDFCIKALKDALSGSKPEIFNSDQGVQFTNDEFINCLKEEDIKISMDGRGRAYDNIFIERLWRTVKYEEVYLDDYKSVRDAAASLTKYFKFYNEERPHQSLAYKTPYEVYHGNKQEVKIKNINLCTVLDADTLHLDFSPIWS